MGTSWGSVRLGELLGTAPAGGGARRIPPAVPEPRDTTRGSGTWAAGGGSGTPLSPGAADEHAYAVCLRCRRQKGDSEQGED